MGVLHDIYTLERLIASLEHTFCDLNKWISHILKKNFFWLKKHSHLTSIKKQSSEGTPYTDLYLALGFAQDLSDVSLSSLGSVFALQSRTKDSYLIIDY